MSIMDMLYVQIGSDIRMDDWVFVLLVIIWTALVLFAGYYFGMNMGGTGKGKPDQ